MIPESRSHANSRSVSEFRLFAVQNARLTFPAVTEGVSCHDTCITPFVPGRFRGGCRNREFAARFRTGGRGDSRL